MPIMCRVDKVRGYQMQALWRTVILIFLFTLSATAYGESKRSYKAKKAFKIEKPCPATGRTKGSCPGYIIDHIKPLACGGADHPSNMQWQTKEDAKAKDGWERKHC